VNRSASPSPGERGGKTLTRATIAHLPLHPLPVKGRRGLDLSTPPAVAGWRISAQVAKSEAAARRASPSQVVLSDGSPGGGSGTEAVASSGVAEWALRQVARVMRVLLLGCADNGEAEGVGRGAGGAASVRTRSEGWRLPLHLARPFLRC
jgi:hypothetical protein